MLRFKFYIFISFITLLIVYHVIGFEHEYMDFWVYIALILAIPGTQKTVSKYEVKKNRSYLNEKKA